jgi:hypothetical protein
MPAPEYRQKNINRISGAPRRRNQYSTRLASKTRASAKANSKRRGAVIAAGKSRAIFSDSLIRKVMSAALARIKNNARNQ